LQLVFSVSIRDTDPVRSGLRLGIRIVESTFLSPRFCATFVHRNHSSSPVTGLASGKTGEASGERVVAPESVGLARVVERAALPWIIIAGNDIRAKRKRFGLREIFGMSVTRERLCKGGIGK
jgi:hypothetical protein